MPITAGLFRQDVGDRWLLEPWASRPTHVAECPGTPKFALTQELWHLVRMKYSGARGIPQYVSPLEPIRVPAHAAIPQVLSD